MDIDNSNLDSKEEQPAKKIIKNIEHSQPEMTGTGTLSPALVKFVLGLHAHQGIAVDQDMFEAAKNGGCKTVEKFREMGKGFGLCKTDEQREMYCGLTGLDWKVIEGLLEGGKITLERCDAFQSWYAVICANALKINSHLDTYCKSI